MKKKAALTLLAFFLTIGLSVNHHAQAVPPAAVGDYVAFLPFISQPIPPTWIGPDGGKIISLAVDPNHPDTVYAGTWGAGVFKSTNGGLNWYPVNAGLGNAFVYSLEINPIQSNIVYAGTYRGKLFKSLDGGQSWFSSSAGIQDQAIVYAIAIDPLNPDQLYIATRGISNNGNPPWSGIVYRSSDGGTSWHIALNNVPGPWQQDWAYSLAVHPTSPNIIFAATHEYGIFRSDDYGYNWYTANGGLVDYSTRDIVIDNHHAPFYAYAGFWHGSGVLKSIDEGLDWSPTSDPLTGVKIYRMAIDRNLADTIYLATQSYQGIIKSSNGGSNWFQSGLLNQIIWKVAINPQNSQVLYSGTDVDGVYKSTNAGSSWYHAQKGLTNISATGLVTLLGDPNTLYVSTLMNGVLKTSDYGSSWNEYNLNLGDRSIHALVQHPTNPNLVYALSDSAGLYTTNISLGNGWTASSGGLPVKSTPVLAFGKDHPFASSPIVDEDLNDLVPEPKTNLSSTLYSPLLCMSFALSNPNIAYLGTSGAGVYKSSNGAASWSPAGLTGLSIWSLAVDPINPNLVYAAVDAPGGVKVSHDGGATWEDLPIGTLKVYSMAFSTSSPATLYAGTSWGLYQWVENFGWLNRGLAGKNVTVIAAHPSIPDTIYVGTDNGTYTYLEYGGTWSEGPAVLLGHTIQAINFDLNNIVKGYFSTSTQGVLLAQIK